MAFGLNGSTESPATITPSAPAASASRMTVPALPGSLAWTSTTISFGEPARTSETLICGCAHRRTRPCGVIASDSRHVNGGALTADGCSKLTRHLDLWARLALRVTDDGRASCNRGPLVDITSAQLIAARELQRDLTPLAERRYALPPGGDSILRYRVVLEMPPA